MTFKVRSKGCLVKGWVGFRLAGAAYRSCGRRKCSMTQIKETVRCSGGTQRRYRTTEIGRDQALGATGEMPENC